MRCVEKEMGTLAAAWERRKVVYGTGRKSGIETPSTVIREASLITTERY